MQCDASGKQRGKAAERRHPLVETRRRRYPDETGQVEGRGRGDSDRQTVRNGKGGRQRVKGAAKRRARGGKQKPRAMRYHHEMAEEGEMLEHGH